jgi:glycosyltransferase involved in cell wall biosynthesis
MTEPLLSICIPTYNRAKYLAVLLESIDLQGVPDHLYEVHVRDNASTDDSAAVFRKVARDRPNWHWQANQENRGGLINIRLCTENATGRFVWIVGSDDRLKPDALAPLLEVLQRCADANAAALFQWRFLGKDFAKARPFEPPFCWLRYVSVNVPAFITSVVWDREFWRNFPYEKYPANLSLPQLDAFVSACMTSTVFGCSREPFIIDWAEHPAKASYWYYRRFPIDNVFEYPLLYRKILKSSRLDFHTRIYVWLRRTANIRLMYPKLLFLRYNEQYYHARARDLREAHGSTLAWPLIYLLARFILETRAGGRLAERRWKESPKLPAQEKIDATF